MRISSITKNAGKACNNRLYRHIRTFEKIVKNYFVIYTYIGAIMSIYTLVFLWIIYILYYRLKERKLLATGITFLFAIPFTLLINITLSKLIGEPVIDVWDILSVFILLIVSVAFIIGDYARKKGFVR